MALMYSTGLRQLMMGTSDFKTTMANGILAFYSGSQPASADAAETGTLLIKYTKSAGAFTPGVSTNGINFDAPVAGVCSKAVAETWQGVGLANGTAGWFRFYANDMTTGADTTHARFDGAISTTGAEVNMVSTTITSGATDTINTFKMTFNPF